MASYKDYTSMCNSAPSELLAEIALKHIDKILEINKSIVLNNLKIIEVISIFENFIKSKFK